MKMHKSNGLFLIAHNSMNRNAPAFLCIAEHLLGSENGFL